jgi:hypothetical protein
MRRERVRRHALPRRLPTRVIDLHPMLIIKRGDERIHTRAVPRMRRRQQPRHRRRRLLRVPRGRRRRRQRRRIPRSRVRHPPRRAARLAVVRGRRRRECELRCEHPWGFKRGRWGGILSFPRVAKPSLKLWVARWRWVGVRI